MTPESMIELLCSGNEQTVEDEWLQVIASPDLDLATLRGYAPVLEELRKSGRAPLAGTLAWAAVESVGASSGNEDTLSIAGPFLLAVGQSDELRTQVAQLYKDVYADVPGLEDLMNHAGIAGGRPVRRALRTMDVCLAVKEGGYLVGRHEDEAAVIERIGRDPWEIEITVDGLQEVLEPVHLADRFRPVAADDFNVLRHFDKDGLKKLLVSDPAAVVVDICRHNDNRIDSDTLKAKLVPGVFDEATWKTWWTRARAALKRSPNIALEGRNPYIVSISELEISHGKALWTDIQKERDPEGLLPLVNAYLRDCKGRGQEPDTAALKQCHEQICERAEDRAANRSPFAGTLWLTAKKAGDVAGIDGAQQGAVDYIRRSDDLRSLVLRLKTDELVDGFCTCLKEAIPDDWQSQLLSLVPLFPPRSCGFASAMLVEAGCTPESLEALAQSILSDPIHHFAALLWLWDGASVPQEMVAHSQPMLFGRILRGLEDAGLSDTSGADRVREMKSRVRSILAARKYERFQACLDGLDEGTSRTIRRRVSRSDMLGPAIREDLLRRLDERFPPGKPEADMPPWAREDVLFVTAEGMQRKRAEVDEHVNVKMKENAVAIGNAAERGDLSENSEYKFALEERDLLRARLGQMNAETAKAKIIDADDVPTDHIGIGTHALFRRLDDGAIEEMTFAGGWDADLAKGWYNYQSPLGQRLMGLRIGDHVQLDHGDAAGEYEVFELQNALRELPSTP